MKGRRREPKRNRSAALRRPTTSRLTSIAYSSLQLPARGIQLSSIHCKAGMLSSGYIRGEKMGLQRNSNPHPITNELLSNFQKEPGC